MLEPMLPRLLVLAALALAVTSPRPVHAQSDDTLPDSSPDELVAPPAPESDEGSGAGPGMWTPHLRQLAWLTGGTGLASSAAMFVGGIAIGVAWFTVTGLLTLFLLRIDPTFTQPWWFFGMMAWMCSIPVTALGALASYAVVRLVTPYFMTPPDASAISASRRVRLGVVFNIVDAALHVAAIAVAAAATAFIAAALCALWLGSSLVAVLLLPATPGGFGPHPAVYVLLFGGAIAWFFGGVPGAATVFVAALLPAFVAAQAVTPVVAMSLEERLERAASPDSGAPAPSSAPAQAPPAVPSPATSTAP